MDVPAANAILPTGSVVCIDIKRHRCNYNFGQFFWGALVSMDRDFVVIRGTMLDMFILEDDEPRDEFALIIIPWAQIGYVNTSHVHNRNGRMLNTLGRVAFEMDHIKVVDELGSNLSGSQQQHNLRQRIVKKPTK